jgi:hypothetical protein
MYQNQSLFRPGFKLLAPILGWFQILELDIFEVVDPFTHLCLRRTQQEIARDHWGLLYSGWNCVNLSLRFCEGEALLGNRKDSV